MRMAKKKTETASEEPSKETTARGKFTRANKCMKTTTKKLHESGKHNGKREKKKSSADSPDESPSSQVQRCINIKDGAQQVPVLDPHPVRPSGKMKLQLFPLDAHTRQGLEKDGFHPYLELTLSSRKKVSSVLQHIQSKWGSSQIARGDPALYPYDTSSSSGPKWTANSITIRDVYVAIGAPSLFRLRYGWSSETCNKTDEPPSPSTPGITCFPNLEPQDFISNKRDSASITGKEMFGSDNLNQVTDPPLSEHTSPDEQGEPEKKINDGSGPTFFSWDDGLTSLSIGGLLSEVSLKGRFGNDSKTSNANPTLWDENFTNISMGGLFSEASLQGRRDINREQESTLNNNNDQASVSIGGLLSEASSQGKGRLNDGNKTWEARGAISQQPLPLISDSLDAFFVNQTTDQPRASYPVPPPPEMSHSSILDGEDTCHAFSFRKRLTTSPKVLEQVSEETEEQQQKDESKSAKGLFGVFNQDSSLGFSAIKWADSRGPFDFGLSLSSRKFTNGDSLSIGAVVKDLQEVEPSEEKIKFQKH